MKLRKIRWVWIRYSLFVLFLGALLSACSGGGQQTITQPTQPAASGGSAPAPTSASAGGGDTTPTEPAALPGGGDVAAGQAIFEGKVTVEGAAPCYACHLVTGDQNLVGPNLAGISDRAATRVPGQSAQEYIRNSILNPNEHLVEGFTAGMMPLNYGTTLSEEQINNLVAYLLTL